MVKKKWKVFKLKRYYYSPVKRAQELYTRNQELSKEILKTQVISLSVIAVILFVVKLIVY